jgi:hypothetical protein
VHVLSEALSVGVLIKMGAAVAMVVLLSFLAEVVSTQFAGIVSGYPLGAALSLFFFGYEISPEFAAESAPYTCLGLIATLAFSFCYYQTSLLLQMRRKVVQILSAAIGGLAGYFLSVSILQVVRVNFISALLLPILAIILFHHLFRNARIAEIQDRIRMSPPVLFARAIFAAIMIVLITFTANSVGPNWAGMFAAFPMTMLPLLLIIHFSYDSEHVYSVLKNFPKGLGAAVVYSLAVIFSYPAFGIYAGTAVAYGVATLYLVLIQSSQWWGRLWKA